MSDYEALERYNLSQHGDHWEKKLWDVVKTEFPAYEAFWRRYVVPLTNRVTAIQRSAQEWINPRSEIEIGSDLDRMRIYHYSVFYYLARAKKRMGEDKTLFPEDVFALLQACVENVIRFFAIIDKIAVSFGGRALNLPTKKHIYPNPSRRSCCDSTAPFAILCEIKDYRDAMLHDPVLGRRFEGGREFLPKSGTPLEQVREKHWRAPLKNSDVIESRALCEGLYVELTALLNAKWNEIVAALDKVRELPEFKATCKLGLYLPIKEPATSAFVVTSAGIPTSSSCSPTAVSAIMMPRVEPT